METRDFHVSGRTFVRVYHNVQALNIGTAIFKSRAGLEAILPHQIRFTLTEWKNFQTILPTLVQEATDIHRAIISGKHHPPILKESRHVLSSRSMVNLSVTRSATEGTYVFLFVGSYDRHETGDIIPSLLRGVNLTFEEIVALSETNKIIEKYIADQLSTTKLITLRGVADVLRTQNFISTFYSDGLKRVRLLLEKPKVPNGPAAAAATAAVSPTITHASKARYDTIVEENLEDITASPPPPPSPSPPQELDVQIEKTRENHGNDNVPSSSSSSPPPYSM